MKPMNEKTLVFAHRGASGYAPENTMESFELSTKMGIDGIELDVLLTADDQVVICHDGRVDRTSNRQGPIVSYTLAELKKMDFGYHFYGNQRKGIRIPTLDEVYDLVAPLDIMVNVEMKVCHPKIVEKCEEIARRHNMKEKIIYSSGDHFLIQRMKEFDPSSFIAPIYMVNLLKPWNYCLDINAQASHPSFNQIMLVKDYVKNCHDRGLRVNTWTVNTEEDMQFVLDQGVDGMITNYPDVAVKLRNQKFAK